MFFVLSKTAIFLVMPLTIIFAVLLASRVLRSQAWQRRCLTAGLILFFFFSNEFISNELMKAWEVDPVAYSEMKHYKLGILLTGTVIPELKPDDRVYFSKGADRVVHTVQLYKLGLIDKILVSGGSGRVVDIGEREADRFKEAMVLMGVPDSVIMLENRTRNTYESALEVKKILTDAGYSAEDCVLITSAFHMRRALACYRKAGLPLDPFSTDFYAHAGRYYPDAFLVPKIGAFIMWEKMIREWIGIAAYWITGRI